MQHLAHRGRVADLDLRRHKSVDDAEDVELVELNDEEALERPQRTDGNGRRTIEGSDLRKQYRGKEH